MLSLISVNIENRKHLSTVLPFVEERKPEVLCLQEVPEEELPKFAEAIGATHSYFAPMIRVDGKSQGIALLSRYPFSAREQYYHHSRDEVMEFMHTDEETSEAFVLLMADIDAPDGMYRIGTTHFVWTPHGEADEFQRAALTKLEPMLAEERPFVLCGDFNAPRGGEIANRIEAKYPDAIPPEYVTSMDAHLHRAGQTCPECLADKMVDHLFMNPEYRAEGVELVSGVSDHMAIVATIHKA